MCRYLCSHMSTRGLYCQIWCYGEGGLCRRWFGGHFMISSGAGRNSKGHPKGSFVVRGTRSYLLIVVPNRHLPRGEILAGNGHARTYISHGRLYQGDPGY